MRMRHTPHVIDHLPRPEARQKHGLPEGAIGVAAEGRVEPQHRQQPPRRQPLAQPAHLKHLKAGGIVMQMSSHKVWFCFSPRLSDATTRSFQNKKDGLPS